MKKRVKLLFALAVMLLVLCGSTALADSLRFGTVTNSNKVNLREGASKSYDIIGSYQRGTWLRINGDYGDWYKVTGPDGRTGYMMKDYIYITAGAKGIIGIVDVNSSLNMRASASYSGRVIASYPDGTPCILLSETGEWYHVSVDGKNGYFHEDYLDTQYTTYSPDVCTVVNANGGNVNLRKGPGKSYGIVKSIKNGSFGMILQQGNGWWKISVGGYVGYMDSSYLQDGIVRKTTSGGSSSSGNTGSSVKDGYATVNTGKLYLRQSASKSSRSLGLFPRGTYVTVLEQGNTWCKVKVNGTTGYMMTEYLKFHGLSATATAYVKHPSGSYVNMRNAPSKSTGTVLYRVPHGTKITVLTPGSTWSQIKYNGKTGYMMTQFIDD
nr:SH3 domain-containing protein [Clostridia bacterium]